MEINEYSWRIPPSGAISAEVAGRELERIEAVHGRLDPDTIVDEARKKRSPIHNAFNWDDKTAADAHRRAQARNLVVQLKVEVVAGDTTKSSRRFFSVTLPDETSPTYVSLERALSSDVLSDQIKRAALNQLKAWNYTYENYQYLEATAAHVSKAVETLAPPRKRPARKKRRRG